jgi:hypothetical protein
MRGGDVVEERTTVHDECKWTRLGKVELARVYLYVFDQYAEQDDGVLRFVAEWPIRWGRDG